MPWRSISLPTTDSRPARPDVVCLTTGPFAENCFLLADPAARLAVLIDPGEDTGRFLAALRESGCRLEGIWLTHAHIDHIQGVEEVKQATGAPVFLHPGDRSLYGAMAEQGAWLGVPAGNPPPPDHELAHGQRLRLGAWEFEVRHVPGHSPGSVAFVGAGLAFVGDALFAGSIGRTDLPGGDARTLLGSIRDQLLSLPDQTVVYSGHGPETTIGEERRSNPFLTGAVRIA